MDRELKLLEALHKIFKICDRLGVQESHRHIDQDLAIAHDGAIQTIFEICEEVLEARV